MNIATKKWIFLKLASVILLPLMFWFIFNFVSIYDKSFYEIVEFFSNQLLQSCYLVYLLFLHSFFQL